MVLANSSFFLSARWRLKPATDGTVTSLWPVGFTATRAPHPAVHRCSCGVPQTLALLDPVVYALAAGSGEVPLKELAAASDTDDLHCGLLRGLNNSQVGRLRLVRGWASWGLGQWGLGAGDEADGTELVWGRRVR